MANLERICPLCAAQNVRSPLKLYQINEEEAIYMCCQKDCPYPVGVCDPAQVIEHRLVPELTTTGQQQLTCTPPITPSAPPPSATPTTEQHTQGGKWRGRSRDS